jgi:hypothetical protein
MTSVEAAVGAVGCGYDLTGDLRLGRAKPVGRLVEIDAVRARDLTLRGGAVILGCRAGSSPTRASGIVADKGERTRSTPCSTTAGTGAGTWSPCFDGRFVELYSVEAMRAQLALQDIVKHDLPPFCDPPRPPSTLLPPPSFPPLHPKIRHLGPLRRPPCSSPDSSPASPVAN